MCSFVIDMLRSLATSLTFNLNLMRAAYTLPCLDGSQCVMVLLFERYLKNVVIITIIDRRGEVRDDIMDIILPGN